MPETQTRTVDQMYSAAEVARLLGISQATFFRLSYFKAKKVRISAQRVGYLASDVYAFQTLNRGR